MRLGILKLWLGDLENKWKYKSLTSSVFAHTTGGHTKMDPRATAPKIRQPSTTATATVKNKKKKTTAEALGHDVLCIIFSFLDLVQLIRCSAVSTSWYDVKFVTVAFNLFCYLLNPITFVDTQFWPASIWVS